MSKDSFVKGAAILGIAGLIVKVLGAIYRIPLTNLIGTEGIGYYQPSYNIYNLLLAVSLAGFPTAIARMISEKRALKNYQGALQVYKVSLYLLFGLGLGSALLVLLLAKPIMYNVMKSPSSYLSLLALTPALFFVPILSAFRGFFQGSQEMLPLALSQVFEQVVRIIVGFVLAYSFVKVGLEEAAAGATFGASVGSFVGLSLIFLFFILRKEKTSGEIRRSDNNSLDTKKNIMFKLLAIAVPITIGASISPVMGIMDNYFVYNRLPILGYTEAQIADMFGQLSGTAYTMINFPQAFSTAIAMSLVPVIADAFVTKDYNRLNRTSDTGVKLSLIIALPCGIGLFMLAEPIIQFLFPSIGVDKYASSAVLLKILSISVIFLIMVQAFTAMLQSVNKQSIPVRNLFVGLFIKVALSFTLISIPSVNIKGAAFSTLGAYIVVMILDYLYIIKKTKIKLTNIFITAALPMLSTAIMAIVVFLVDKFLRNIISSNSIVTILAIVLGGLSYIIALFATGTITREDLDLVPMGNKLKRFTRK